MFKVTAYKFKVTAYKFKVTAYKFKVTAYKFKVTAYKFKVTAYNNGAKMASSVNITETVRKLHVFFVFSPQRPATIQTPSQKRVVDMLQTVWQIDNDLLCKSTVIQHN